MDPKGLVGILFPPRSESWIAILRIGLGLQLSLYCLNLRHDWWFFLARAHRLTGRELSEGILDFQSPFIPRVEWIVSLLSPMHLDESTVLALIWSALLVAGACLSLGLFCRTSAFTGWFLYLISVKSANLYSYGVDNFTIIGLFYLMIAPLPDRWSLDAKMGKGRVHDPMRVGFHRRVLQLHLCVIYFFSGFTKATGPGWWDGTSIWRALICPPFNVVPVQVILWFRYLLPVAGICVCLLELCYPFFIWRKTTRPFWLVGIVAMHLGIGLTMGLYLFSLIMIVLNLAGFAARETPVAAQTPSALKPAPL